MTPMASRTLHIPDIATVHVREVWEGNTTPISGNGYTAPSLDVRLVDHVRAHYTAAANLPDGDAGPNEDIPAVLRFLQSTNAGYRLHRRYSLGYSFAIDYLGGVWEIRGFDYRPAANNGDRLVPYRGTTYKAINLNRHTFAILFLVDGDDPPTFAAQASARALIREMRRRVNAAGGRMVEPILRPHSESDATSCPGNGIRGVIALGWLHPDHVPAAPPPPPFIPPAFPPIGDLTMIPLPPSPANRILDTRKIQSRPLAGNVDHVVNVAHTKVPAAAKAVKVNLAAVGPAESGWLAAWSHGQFPGHSTVNYTAGQVAIANEVTVLLEPGTRQFRIRSNTPIHVLVDLVGYYV